MHRRRIATTDPDYRREIQMLDDRGTTEASQLLAAAIGQADDVETIDLLWQRSDLNSGHLVTVIQTRDTVLIDCQNCINVDRPAREPEFARIINAATRAQATGARVYLHYEAMASVQRMTDAEAMSTIERAMHSGQMAGELTPESLVRFIDAVGIAAEASYEEWSTGARAAIARQFGDEFKRGTIDWNEYECMQGIGPALEE